MHDQTGTRAALGIGDLGFLPEPLQPGFLKLCDECGKWFALEVFREEPDEVYTKITYYRCKYCGDEIASALQHPDHAL